MTQDCIFCRIAGGTASESLVTETPDALAFMDINQPTPGHVLVIPRRHVQDIYTLDEATAAMVFQLAVRVAQAVKIALRPDGINLYQSNEHAAGQEVFHFHMHVVARYAGDRDRVCVFLQPNLPPHAELDRLAAEIRAAL
ncbi:MAG: HIT family protein [Chloroflexi bacterium]|nr:HIT family protein [Chloroflexota bacterium]